MLCFILGRNCVTSSRHTPNHSSAAPLVTRDLQARWACDSGTVSIEADTCLHCMQPTTTCTSHFNFCTTRCRFSLIRLCPCMCQSGERYNVTTPHLPEAVPILEVPNNNALSGAHVLPVCYPCTTAHTAPIQMPAVMTQSASQASHRKVHQAAPKAQQQCTDVQTAQTQNTAQPPWRLPDPPQSLTEHKAASGA